MTELLDTDATAAFLGMSKPTLEHWRGLRKGPPFVRIGPRCVRYRRNDLETWLGEQMVETAN